jgi:hypothetical protein
MFMQIGSENQSDKIISDTYKPLCKIYNITPPTYETGYVYHFATDSGLEYEVRFAHKTDNNLLKLVNFTVLGNDFDQDYPVTNRGEMYSIIATVIEILRTFHFYHNFTKSYEFSGAYKENEKKNDIGSIRSRMYMRWALKVLNNNWTAIICGNKVIIKRL